MSQFQIIEARPWHCGVMSRILRREQQAECLRRNVNIHRELRTMYQASYFRRAWTIDGRLAGLGGVKGSVLSPTGMIWVALSEEAMKYPIAIVKEARRQLDEIMRMQIELTTSVSYNDEAAQRFAVFLGFGVGGDEAFSRAGRRNLIDYMNSEPSLRILAGSHWQIAVSKHREYPHA